MTQLYDWKRFLTDALWITLCTGNKLYISDPTIKMLTLELTLPPHSFVSHRLGHTGVGDTVQYLKGRPLEAKTGDAGVETITRVASRRRRK